MFAWNNDAALQTNMLAQVDEHIRLDQVIQGQYWTGSKGCFIGCLAHGSSATRVEELTGWPAMLTKIAEGIFEGLAKSDAPAFFERAMKAPRLGANLSLVLWGFLHWCVTDALEQYADAKTRKGCAAAVEVLRVKAEGGLVTRAADAAAYAAADAASDAADAAAKAAAYAAHAAAYAAYATTYAADAAYAAYATAYAADAAYSAADAYAADAAAAYAARLRQADKFVELLAAAS